jgi:hypothetical protein
MTSRTHRGIGLVFIPLLAIACLLVLQAAPTSSASRKKKNSDLKLYDELKELLKQFDHTKEYLKTLETRIKCPFEVFNVKGYTEVICDFRNCTRGNPCDQDCTQAYLKVNDVIPKTGSKNKKNKKKKKEEEDEEGTRAPILVGCFYTPKDETLSIQSHDADK